MKNMAAALNLYIKLYNKLYLKKLICCVLACSYPQSDTLLVWMTPIATILHAYAS